MKQKAIRQVESLSDNEVNYERFLVVATTAVNVLPVMSNALWPSAALGQRSNVSDAQRVSSGGPEVLLGFDLARCDNAMR